MSVYSQLFQVVGKLQDQVNLCQKAGEPITGPLEITGDITATGNITGANLLTSGDVEIDGDFLGANVDVTGNVAGDSLSSNTTITANGDVSTGGNFVGGPLSTLIIDGNQVVGPRLPNIINLLDNSGGTADNTIAQITEIANPGSADTLPVQNAIADLAAKVNEILTALKGHGLINSI